MKRRPIKRHGVVTAVLLLGAARATSAQTPTLAERLLNSYGAVTSVTCEIRRDITSGQRTVRWLSRVHFQKPDRLHVENVAPVRRRIVADGTNFFSFVEGDPRGFSRPVAELDEEMLAGLRKAPGTPMDHLMKVRGLPETEVPPAGGLPVRRGYAADKVFIVLGVDATGRLTRVEFYESPAMKEQRARFDYDNFQEAAGGAWIPRRHRCTMQAGNEEVVETVRVDHLSVNTPIAPHLFVAAPFFKGVNFAPSFEEVYR